MRWIRVMVVCAYLGVLPPATVFAQDIASPEIHNVGGTVHVRYGDINIGTSIRSGEIPKEVMQRVADALVAELKRQGTLNSQELERQMKAQFRELKEIYPMLKRLEQQNLRLQETLEFSGKQLSELGAASTGEHGQIQTRMEQMEGRIAEKLERIEKLAGQIEEGRLQEVQESLEKAMSEADEMEEKVDKIRKEIKHFIGRYRLYEEVGPVLRLESPLYDLGSTYALYVGGGYSQEFHAWPPETHGYSLAWHVYGLARWGEAAGGFTVPLNDAPVYTPVSFSQRGAVAECGLELRMLRDVHQLAVSMDGRLGWVSYASKGSTDLRYLAPVLAIPLQFTVSWRATGAITLSGQVGLVVDLVATELRYEYTGVGAQARRDDSFIGIHATGGIHVDLAF